MTTLILFYNLPRKLLPSSLEYKYFCRNTNGRLEAKEEQWDIKLWCFQCLMAGNKVLALLVQPFLNFNNKILTVRKIRIQVPVEIKPMYTWGSSIGHPRCKIDRNDSVDFVRGKKRAKALRSGCIPSIGQMIPHNRIKGRKEPNAKYVALRSLSTAQEITKPLKENIWY